jgi:hypothetical protein
VRVPDEARGVIESDALAHVTTIDPDGRPQSAHLPGPDVTFPPMPDPPPGFVTRVTVERLGGVGPWNERTG